MQADSTIYEAQARELLARLSTEEKVAQVSCYFPTDISNTDDFAA